MTFNADEEVLCIDVGPRNREFLSKGEWYYCDKTDHLVDGTLWYRIVDDIGVNNWYLSTHFKTKEELRYDNLKELLE